jgi:hypothetical protein
MEAGLGREPVRVAVGQLLLDAENPRLPESVQGEPQSEILLHLQQTAVLDEIARSMVENGYFEHEPMLVMAAEDGEGWIVLEGNRRLAALIILLQLPPSEEADVRFDLGFDPEPDGWRERLQEVPCFEVADRSEVRRYTGYRHIGGIKAWSAQAKARYLFEEANAAEAQGEENPFLHVARRVGSNSQGVRNAIFAYVVLIRAREDYGVETGHVMEKRFGVWQRALNSNDLREFIGIHWPRRFEEVEPALAELEPQRIEEVLRDLTPQNGSPPLVADSRDVTVYGQALQNEMAYNAMRRYSNLEIARQIVEEAALPTRIRKATASIEAISDQVTRSETVADEVVTAADELANVARGLFDIARGRTRPDVD